MYMFPWSKLETACTEGVDPIWLLGDFNANLHGKESTCLNFVLNKDTSVQCAECKAFAALWMQIFWTHETATTDNGCLDLAARTNGKW
jgi:hypothetical protein